MRSRRLLILLGLALIVIGIIITQEPVITRKEIKYNNVKLSASNSTWTVDLGLLPLDSRILPTLQASINVLFWVWRSDTKEILRTLGPQRYPSLGDICNYTYLSWRIAHGVNSVQYKASATAEYSAVVSIDRASYEKALSQGELKEGYVDITEFEIITEHPPAFPYLVHGLGLIVAGIGVISFSIVRGRRAP